MIALFAISKQGQLIDSAANTSNRVFSNNQIKFSRKQLIKIPWISHDFSKKKKIPWLSQTFCSISHDSYDSADTLSWKWVFDHWQLSEGRWSTCFFPFIWIFNADDFNDFLIPRFDMSTSLQHHLQQSSESTLPRPIHTE